MSGIQFSSPVTNQKASPAVYASSLATRPAPQLPGRIFVDTDNPSTGMYRDTGSAWVQIAAGTGLLNLQTVTDYGNTTTNEVTLGSSTAPTATLDVYGGGDSPDIVAKIQGLSTNSAFIQFTQNGAARFFTGNRYKGGADLFIIGNSITPQDTFLINHSTNRIAIGGHTDTPAYLLSIGGTLQNTTSAYFSTDSGNVGIGTTTASYKIDVNGTARVSGTELRLDNGTSGTINIYSATPTINFFSAGGYSIGRSSTTIELRSAGSIIQYISGNQAYQIDATNGHLFKSAIAGSASLARLTTGGNLIVGGTTDAGFRADIQGTLRVSGTATFSGTIKTNTIDKNDQNNPLQIYTAYNNINAIIEFWGGTGARLQYNTNTRVLFPSINADISIGTSSLKFNNIYGTNGYFDTFLFVGTTIDSGFKLDVLGSTRINGTLRIDGQTSGSAGGSSGLHLIVNCGGTNYKIALNNV